MSTVTTIQAVAQHINRWPPCSLHRFTVDRVRADMAEVLRDPRVELIDGYVREQNADCLIEVAESTLERDRGGKLIAYAKGGVPTYWIVDLVERQIEVYTQPSLSR